MFRSFETKIHETLGVTSNHPYPSDMILIFTKYRILVIANESLIFILAIP